MKNTDYRESHLNKGVSYHDTFINKPYRAAIWELEQELLSKIVKKYFGNSKIPDYLDFACGTGRVLQFIENRSVNSTGVDISGSMLKEAESNTKSAKLIETDITNNDLLGKHKYDLITAFRFFPNAQHELRKQVIEVLYYHLKDDGFFVFNNHMNSKSLKYRIKRFLTKTKKLKQGMDYYEITDFMDHAGIEVIDAYHVGFLPFNEAKPRLSRKQLKFFEKIFMKLRYSFFRNLSQDIIYVCQKK
jgi:SAM-dependent methyltransferase